MDMGDYYNATATPTRASGVVAPQVAAVGPGVSGAFNVGASLGTSGMPTILGGFAVLVLAFWLLHNG